MMQLATAGRRDGSLWRHRLQTKTTVGENRKNSSDYYFGCFINHLRQLRNCSGRVVTTHTQKQEVSHHWPTLYCTHQLWYKQGVSRQSAD